MYVYIHTKFKLQSSSYDTSLPAENHGSRENPPQCEVKTRTNSTAIKPHTNVMVFLEQLMWDSCVRSYLGGKVTGGYKYLRKVQKYFSH